MNLKWDVPINFQIIANTETEAVSLIKQELDRMIKRRGLGELVDFDFFEFIGESEDSNS